MLRALLRRRAPPQAGVEAVVAVDSPDPLRARAGEPADGRRGEREREHAITFAKAGYGAEVRQHCESGSFPNDEPNVAELRPPVPFAGLAPERRRFDRLGVTVSQSCCFD